MAYLTQILPPSVSIFTLLIIPPVAIDANLNTEEDIVSNGILGASDLDGDTLIYSLSE